jgi:hypothetical protein
MDLHAPSRCSRSPLVDCLDVIVQTLLIFCAPTHQGWGSGLAEVSGLSRCSGHEDMQAVVDRLPDIDQHEELGISQSRLIKQSLAMMSLALCFLMLLAGR